MTTRMTTTAAAASAAKAGCAGGAAGVRPLLSAGRRVTVDGHAICDECGRAVEPVGLDQWRHGLSRRPRLTPLASYAEFTRRFPWVVVAEDEWRGAATALAEYKAKLKAFKRKVLLVPGGNPCFDLYRLLMAAPTRLLDLEERRRELASLFSWAIPTEAALEVLARHAPLVECGAGTGYWLALLRLRGVDAIGYDQARPGRANAYHCNDRGAWISIERSKSAAAARRHPERALVLCWPPYDDDAASYEVLRAYRGDVVIHIGERDEGATGSVRFHRELAMNWSLIEEVELPHWPRLQDRLMVYRRNPVRRPHLERDRCFECRQFMPTGAIGRCDACFRKRPPALALRVGKHRIEYPREVVDAMPPALRRAFGASPTRIRLPRPGR
jgi:hypothetical protein